MSTAKKKWKTPFTSHRRKR